MKTKASVMARVMAALIASGGISVMPSSTGRTPKTNKKMSAKDQADAVRKAMTKRENRRAKRLLHLNKKGINQ